jgi:hypothetical protein
MNSFTFSRSTGVGNFLPKQEPPMKPSVCLSRIGQRLLAGVLALMATGSVNWAASLVLSNTNKPPRTMRLVFIHHSTGMDWLADGHGGLGLALRDHGYFVSDSDYGWGPDAVGDTTDIGHWWRWFRSPDSGQYLAALFSLSDPNCEYSRLDTAPGEVNEIIMFKSCFPNSALQGLLTDPVPPIDENPLRNQDSGSEFHTVAHAKGIYLDLLNYFATRPDKLFVVITAPPLSDSTYANNARAFNNWLVRDWLNGYPQSNVFVFDFYNVLTSNGGSPAVNDAQRQTGNHHRWWQGAVQHKTDGGYNVSAYATAPDNDHPNAVGDAKATLEFVPLLNAAVNAWLAASVPVPRLTATRTGSHQFEWTAAELVVGISYTIERTTDLTAGSWTDVANWMAATSSTSGTVVIDVNSPRAFYRLKSP